MRLSVARLGGKFGQLAKYRNIVECRISSYEINPMKGFISKGFPNLCRRFLDQVFYIAPPFIGAYAFYEWAEAENARLSRKNPKDFENDV